MRKGSTGGKGKVESEVERQVEMEVGIGNGKA